MPTWSRSTARTPRASCCTPASTRSAPTVVLKGTLSGAVLTVDIPPLGGGVGAIAEFDTLVKAGKYVQGRCKDKKINYTGEFRFNDAPTAVAQDQQKCKQKKKK